jgi:hypothetical protein
MALPVPRLIRLLLGFAIVVASLGSQSAVAATNMAGGVQSFETPASIGGDAGGVNRSHSGSADSMPVGAFHQPHNVTTSSPGLMTSFDGVNHFLQRFGTANQFSLEPPDQGLCVGKDAVTGGNTRVLEVVNDTFALYDTSGTLLGLDSLNHFLGYAPAIIRNPLTFGPFVTDPSCLYDAPTHRWFVDVLTLDTFPTVGADGLQHFTGVNHLDLAVSQTADPAGSWSFFHIDVTDDGSNGFDSGCSTGNIGLPPGPGTHVHACIGDYPHIGSNADGIYLTTNEYSLFGNEFHGAIIYAMSKAQLEVANPSGTSVGRYPTHGLDSGFARNGFTLWPSVTPTSAGYGTGDSTSGGTEYFLSSNAAAEAHDPGDGSSTFEPSTELLVWSLTNTSSLGSGNPTLSHAKLGVGQYTFPPSATQKSGSQPLRECLNNASCSTFLEGIADPFSPESKAKLDSNDTRMQQVTWVNGSLWGALDTGLNTSNHKQAGIEWFKVSANGGSAGAKLANSGYVGLGNDNLTYPAIGITAGGNGVMAFTVVGSNFFPSAGYALIGNGGVGDVHIAAAGQGPDDGFTNYRFFANPPNFTARPRWGDYGAAVPWGNNVWIASEYIGQTCSLQDYLNQNLGLFTCGLTRTALANWDTRISLVSAS